MSSENVTEVSPPSSCSKRTSGPDATRRASRWSGPASTAFARAARSPLSYLAFLLAIGASAGFPWSTPDTWQSLARTIIEGPDEPAVEQLRVLECLEGALLTIPDGSKVTLDAPDPWWFQRTIEIGFPRIEFVESNPEFMVTVSGEPVSTASSDDSSRCGPLYVEIAANA